MRSEKGNRKKQQLFNKITHTVLQTYFRLVTVFNTKKWLLGTPSSQVAYVYDFRSAAEE